MKSTVLALAASLLLAATSAHAQQAQPAAAQPQADVATAAPVANAQTCTDREGRTIPCPAPVEKVGRNYTPIILGAVGAAALIGAAGGGGDDSSPSPPSPSPSPSSP